MSLHSTCEQRTHLILFFVLDIIPVSYDDDVSVSGETGCCKCPDVQISRLNFNLGGWRCVHFNPSNVTQTLAAMKSVKKIITDEYDGQKFKNKSQAVKNKKQEENKIF